MDSAQIWPMCLCVVKQYSLVFIEAGVGEGLDLHGRFMHLLPSLHGYDCPLNALLQVGEATDVALRLQRRDVRGLHPEGVSGAVGAHGVVDVHADGVVHFRRQAGRGRGGGIVFAQLEDDTWEK